MTYIYVCRDATNSHHVYNSSGMTGEVRQIKKRITCKSSNVTYMINCLRCKKQYRGETKRMLREHIKNHGQATNNPNHSDTTAAVPTHFNLSGHCAKDMRPISLELQRPIINGSRRKARRAYLIERGKTS